MQGRPQLRLEAGLQVLAASRAPGFLLFLVVLVSLPSCAIPSGLPGGDRAGPVDFRGPPRISVVPRSGAQISSSCLQSSPQEHRGLPGRAALGVMAWIPGGEVRAGRWVGHLGVLEDKDRRAAWQWDQTARQCHRGTRRRVGRTVVSGRGCVWGTALWSLRGLWEETDSGQFNLF